jgi:hypothetical protein
MNKQRHINHSPPTIQPTHFQNPQRNRQNLWKCYRAQRVFRTPFPWQGLVRRHSRGAGAQGLQAIGKCVGDFGGLPPLVCLEHVGGAVYGEEYSDEAPEKEGEGGV